MSFNKDVYDVVRLIPHGRVTAYGAIAKYLGDARASRRVGWALNSSFTEIPKVPAHRVCLLYTSPSPRDMRRSRMPSSA